MALASLSSLYFGTLRYGIDSRATSVFGCHGDDAGLREVITPICTIEKLLLVLAARLPASVWDDDGWASRGRTRKLLFNVEIAYRTAYRERE
jgi:hypothetical protein